MQFVITVTVKSPSSSPVDVTWYRGDNHAEALAALVQAGAKDVADESMPESIRTKVIAVKMDIFHDEPEQVEGWTGSSTVSLRHNHVRDVTCDEDCPIFEGHFAFEGDHDEIEDEDEDEDEDDLEDQPLYTHDCETCIYLGQYTDLGSEVEWDLYYHPGETVVGRNDSDGPSYISGLSFVDRDPVLTEAYRRAVAEGLIEGKV